MFHRTRHALRARLMRAVDEVTQRHRHEHEETLRREVDRAIGAMRAAVHEAEIRSRRDLLVAADREASATSARFAAEMMPAVPTFPYPQATLEHALALAPADGMALEFGVFSGQTLKIIREARDGCEVYGFDSFQGLPEDWRSGFPAGTFRVDGLPEVPGAELVVGWFDDTLPGFLAEHPGPVAFLHIDGDLYSSARTVLDHVGSRLRPGSVVIFDEYFNYPGWQQHEYRAWQEFVVKSGIRFEYEAYTSDNEQVVLRVTEPRLGSPATGLISPVAAPRSPIGRDRTSVT